MAMNNWGGVKEHMNKRPRTFGGNKRGSRKLNQMGDQPPVDFSLAERKRRTKMRREILMYVVVLILLLLAFKMLILG